MNKLQKIRNILAENGVECTIDETKSVIKIAKFLEKLSELPDYDLKFLIDSDDHKLRMLYQSVMQIKYGS